MKEDVPGVVLHVSESSLRHCPGHNFIATGAVTLRAEVNSYDLWDDVVDRLDGKVIYTVDSMAEAVLAAAQRRATQAEKRSVETIEKYRSDLDAALARLAFLEAENQRLTGQVTFLTGKNEELQLTVDAQDMALMQR